MRRYQHWLGYWKPEFDLITNVIELVLQVSLPLAAPPCSLLAGMLS